MAMGIIDWIMDNIMPWLFVGFFLLLGALILAIPYWIYVEAKTPTFELKKDEWVCTDYRKLETTYFVKVGTDMVPQKSYSDVCFNWKRI